MEIIPVFFTFDKYYVIAAEVAIYSLLKHASSKYEYKLYILHTNISPRQQKDLIKLVNRFKNASLCFISTLSFNDDIKTFQNKSHFSGEIFLNLSLLRYFHNMIELFVLTWMWYLWMISQHHILCFQTNFSISLVWVPS